MPAANSSLLPGVDKLQPERAGSDAAGVVCLLTDQMLMRFNQVPRRQYVAFLELLGIRLQPPQAATTELTFYLVSKLPKTYRIPAGTQVATERTANEEAVIFSTDRPLEIGQPCIRHLLTA